ncbi:T9SS type A sorting domain-containing protein [Mangrovimonas sp. TPBH4]|uniref:T9SS type A sorting domain-containing protein n=1 Tax=Mangrovimonas sp. TPBH4 TaxID=1645914 RepID=UPI0006B40A3D|nr:T9SS type A sorting domain-containing protein [Mangrovimonas sp. TPBH4]
MKSQTTYIPDNNFEQALIELGFDDIMDNQVLTENISSITFLSVQNKSISDLTGIEDFTSFVEFMCSNNNLESLDLSQNTAIKYLYFTGNSLITEFDASQLPLLRHLFCSYTGLTSLDLSQNPDFQQLICSNTGITSLDLSNNLDLVSIYAKNNNLQFVDLRNNNNSSIWEFNFINNPILPYIYLDNCVFSSANWANVGTNTVFVENEGETECISLSVSEYAVDKEIIIYPNPTESIINIDYVNSVNIENVFFFSIDGKLIDKFENDIKQIDLSNLDSGVYLLKFNTGSGILFKRIIKS